MLPETGLVLIDHEFSGSGYSMMNARKGAIRALEQAGREEAQKAASAVCQEFFGQPKANAFTAPKTS